MRTCKKFSAIDLFGGKQNGNAKKNAVALRFVFIYLLLILFPAGLLFSCSGSGTSNAAGDSNSAVSSSASGSGDDMYYELTTISTGKSQNLKMVTEMFVSSKADMRVEMHINSGVNGQQARPEMILIGHANKPNESIIINDSAKTYTVHSIDTADLNTGFKTEATVTKIGEDKVMGFNSVHAQIISHKKMGSFLNMTDTMNVWRSEDVPMQANVKALFTQYEARTGSYMYSKETAARLKEMGCDGFLVKLTLNGKDYSMVMQLTKVEHRNLSANLFQIPAGYREDKNGM